MKPKILFLLLISVLLTTGMAVACRSNETITPTINQTPSIHTGTFIMEPQSVTNTPEAKVNLDTSSAPSLTPVKSITPKANPTQHYGIQKQGPLSVIQAERLYLSSLKYIANDEKKAIEVALNMGYQKQTAHPSLMCGPLSISILKDAGLLEEFVPLYDFWLLNPREEGVILEKTFPQSKYLWFRTKEPVNKFDFRKFPLHPGDLIYLYSGVSGNFEHFMVITRVDKDGRTYSVTNYGTKSGFVIQEKLVFDPEKPGEGLFFEWTKQPKAILGATGYDGFSLWRLLSPIEEKSDFDRLFNKNITSITNRSGGNWNIFIKEMGGDVLYERYVDEVIHPSSVIKIPVAVLFFSWMDLQKQTDYSTFLHKSGVSGRSFHQLLRAMLVESEEKATIILIDFLREKINTTRKLKEWGILNTSLSPRRTTVKEINLFLENLYMGNWILPPGRKIVLEFMEEYSPNDTTRIGAIRPFLKPGDHIYNKRGTITDERLIVADSGIIALDGNLYTITVFAYPGKLPVTYEALEKGIQEIVMEFFHHLKD